MGRRVILAGYLLFSLWVCLLGLYKPGHNWDLIPYLAAAKGMETRDPAALHAFAYGQAARSAPELLDDRGLPEGDRDYRRIMASDPAAFAEHVQFYQGRVAYVAALFGLIKLGVDPVFATHAISAVAVFLALWLLLAVSRERMNAPFILILPLLALAFGAERIAGLSTPDGLAFLGMLLCVFLYLKGHRALLAALPLLVLIRTDLVLFVIPFLVLLLLAGPYRKGEVLLAFAAPALIYAWVTRHFAHPGFQSVFYLTLVERAASSLAESPGLTLKQILEAWARGGLHAMRNPGFLVNLAFSGLIVSMLGESLRTGRIVDVLRAPATVLFLVATGYIAVHFALFPAAWERFFAGPYTINAVVLFSLLSQRRRPTGGYRKIDAARGNW